MYNSEIVDKGLILFRDVDVEGLRNSISFDFINLGGNFVPFLLLLLQCVSFDRYFNIAVGEEL